MRTWPAVTAAVIASMLVTELVMRPEMTTRIELSVFMVVIAGVAVGVAWWLRGRVGRGRHLRRVLIGLAMVSVAIVVAAVTAASRLMFISTHDVQLLWIVLGFAATVGLILAASVADALSVDLRRIASAARQVGRGDLEARTGVDRPDEVGVVASALDATTARLAILEEERMRNRKIRQEFLASIGHDLRTPLAALQAAVEALQDGLVDDTSRYLRAMGSDVAALASLVDDLFLLTRIESGQLEIAMGPVDLSDLVDETLEALRPVAETHQVELVLEAPGHVRIVGGQAELGRVMRNLVDNAIRHSPPKGRIVVRVDLNGSARVRVSDDGPGFRPEFIPTAFDGFSRDNEARSRDRGGAGLGLAIARAYVSAHGGAIWANPGPGGTVSFEIPLAGQQPGRQVSLQQATS